MSSRICSASARRWPEVPPDQWQGLTMTTVRAMLNRVQKLETGLVSPILAMIGGAGGWAAMEPDAELFLPTDAMTAGTYRWS